MFFTTAKKLNVAKAMVLILTPNFLPQDVQGCSARVLTLSCPTEIIIPQIPHPITALAEWDTFGRDRPTGLGKQQRANLYYCAGVCQVSPIKGLSGLGCRAPSSQHFCWNFDEAEVRHALVSVTNAGQHAKLSSQATGDHRRQRYEHQPAICS